VAVELTVVGSINLDLVARVARLPRPGETVSGARLSRVPGGKGANQAVAAARLGARVRMVGAVGEDDHAEEALAGLRAAGVELQLERSAGSATGLALVLVEASGENQIVVVPGANADLSHAAPARPVDVEPDLLVVNRLEHEVNSRGRLVAVTLGAEGAILLEDGREVARAEPPPVTAVDGTGAGDAFTACLVVSLLEQRPREEALRRACAAGALAASRPGAQPSLPTAAELEAILAS
jgi:ribokinase